MMYQRILKSFGASSFGIAVTLGSQLLLVPFLLIFWGADTYGEWLILSAMPTYIAIADFGFTEYFVNRATRSSAKGKRIFARIFSATGFYSNIFLSGIFLILFYLMIVTSGFLEFFSIEKIERNSALIIVSILAFYAFFCCITTYQTAIYRAELLNHRSLLIVNFVRVLEVFLLVLLVSVFRQPFYAALALLVSRVVGVFIFWMDIKNNLKNIDFSFKYFRARRAKIAISTSLYYFLFPLTNLLQTQGVLLAISAGTNPSFVALFSSLRTISKAVTQIVNAINASTWQEFAWLSAKGEIQVLNRLVLRSALTSAAVGLLFLTIFYIAGSDILRVWTVGELVDSNGLLIVLSLGVLFNSVWITIANCLRASDNHGYLNYIYLLCSVLLVGVILVLGQSVESIIGKCLLWYEIVMFFLVVIIYFSPKRTN